MITVTAQHFLSQSERDAINLYIVFGITALVTIITSPSESLGLRIWTIVVGWYAAIITTAIRRKHSDWLRMLKFLVPLCIFFVFPDGFLATNLQTLEFPDMGVGQVYQVTSFMPLMWAIPLFVVILVGKGTEDRGASTGHAAFSAGLSALVVFLVAEELLTRIPIWHALNCTTIGHIAIYVLFPEFCLGPTAFLMYKFSQFSFLAQIFGAFGIMIMYLGNLVVCFMIIDGGTSF